MSKAEGTDLELEVSGRIFFLLCLPWQVGESLQCHSDA